MVDVAEHNMLLKKLQLILQYNSIINNSKYQLLILPNQFKNQSKILLCEELMEASVSTLFCNGGGGVALSVGQSQGFSRSRLPQQEVRDPKESPTC